MDIKSEKEKCSQEITSLEKQISELSFRLKTAKAKLRKWEKLEEKAKEIADQ
jgi:molecular chaperone GrpE (heat shock protein)